MKLNKLRYDSTFKDLSNESKENFKSHIAKNIKFRGYNGFIRFLFSFGYLIAIILGVILSVVGVFTNFAIVGIGIILEIGGLAILYARFYHTKKILKKAVGITNKLQQEMYAKYFEENYENVSVLGNISNETTRIARSSRPRNIPADARIINYWPGPSIKLNESIVESARVQWRWTRSNGKTTVTYTKNSLTTCIYDISKNLKDLKVEIYPNTLLNKNVKDLENKYFNKKWNYKSNSQVKLRLLLTPFVQEQLIKKGNIFSDNRRDIILKKEVENRFDICMYLSDKITVFSLDGHTRSKKRINIFLKGDKLKNNISSVILEDFSEDVKFLVRLLKNISLFTNLV